MGNNKEQLFLKCVAVNWHSLFSGWCSILGQGAVCVCVCEKRTGEMANLGEMALVLLLSSMVSEIREGLHHTGVYT